MNLVSAFFCSSIGRKIIMAVTGLILIGFVAGHLVGNLQVFQHPDHINGYAQFLHNLGPLLWAARIVIIGSVVLHIWAATALTLENNAARGTVPYGVSHTIRATLASRAMRVTGYIVLAFLLYHLAHFTLGLVQSDTFKETAPLDHYLMKSDYRVAGFVVVKAGTDVPNVHSMVVLGFQKPVVSLFYIVAVGLLSFHLLHGIDSLFQTLGLRSEKWAACLRRAAIVFCLVYFLGNLAIPGAVLAGKLKPQASTVAAAHR
ncbi:MAG: succinate dehydrogenase cytochrome b subunit [Verrucomicrobia bacterium]|nr:succinate dehydrogenase cytochrome b subunit [Verrucomicrobiota bacterium]